MTDKIRIYVYKHARDEFIQGLLDNDISFSRKTAPPGQVMASGEVLEIVKAVGPLLTALAVILVAWVRARTNRKVLVQTQYDEIIHIEGYSAKEIEQLLKIAESILGIVDIEADVEYVLVHRRLPGSRGQVVASTVKVFLTEDSPRFS